MKQSHSAKNGKEGTIWAFLSSNWLQKIKITEEGTLWGHQKVSAKNSHSAEKTVKPNLLSCLVTTKASKTMIARSGTLWKHPKLLSSMVGRPSEIL